MVVGSTSLRRGEYIPLLFRLPVDGVCSCQVRRNQDPEQGSIRPRQEPRRRIRNLGRRGGLSPQDRLGQADERAQSVPVAAEVGAQGIPRSGAR